MALALSIAVMNTDVLIVGAGPTGLALALCLQKLGVDFRIIDALPEPGTQSRAIAVQARTLELYDQLGIAYEVISAGLKLDKPTIWTRGKRRATVNFGDFGKGLSPHPYLVMYPQDAHEKMLATHLRKKIERGVALTGFTQGHAGVEAKLSTGEIVHARYICGCDGARSTVRENVRGDFPGGTYEQSFYVADVDIAQMNHADEFYFFLQNRGFLLALPLPEQNRFRLIGVIPQEIKKDPQSVTFDDIAPFVLRETPLIVSRVRWFSTYRVHHRVTGHFRHSSAFLLGDAAHIHSPAGGQGMNTGIGDAFNLAWKLHAVLKGAPDALLDTYDTERKSFAQRLVATTDRVFMAVVGKNVMSQFVRLWVFPMLLPLLMQISMFRQFAFKTISQLIVQYGDSALSEGAGAGERLPWTGDNFVSLQTMQWQMHVYGAPSVGIATFCRDKNLPLRIFPKTADSQAFLVRPDGYIGWSGDEVSALSAYCARWKIC